MNNEYRTYITLLCSKNAYISLATTEKCRILQTEHHHAMNEYKRNYKLLIKDKKAKLPLTVQDGNTVLNDELAQL